MRSVFRVLFGLVLGILSGRLAAQSSTSPAISAQPQAQSAVAGAAATLSVTATGTPAPAYQWRKGGVAITGATSASYGIASVTAADAGSYDVVLTNSVGTVTSAAAVLTVTGAALDGIVYSTTGAAVTITGYTGLGGAVEIPAQIAGLQVTAIGASAFASKSSITAVTFPSGLVNIDASAFWNCTGLTSVTIPNSVTSIGGSAFGACYALTSITLPASVTNITPGAFGYCVKLTSITVDPANPSYSSDASGLYNKARTTLVQVPGAAAGTYSVATGVTAIGDWAFWGCTSLTSISVPGTVTSIGRSAFESCLALTACNIPSGVTSLGSWAFVNCRELTTATIPASVTSIGVDPFGYCLKLASLTVDPASTSFVADSGVLLNKARTSLIQMMGTFSGAYAVPSTVTSISSGAFEGCAQLTSISLPAGLASLSVEAFRDCAKLTAITVDAANANFTSEGGVLFNKTRTTLLQAPATLAGSYTVPAGVTAISDWAFYRCISLTGITFPGSLVSFGRSAMEGCSGLTSVTFPASVTTLGHYVFRACSNLSSVTFQGNAPAVGTSVFGSSGATRAVFYNSSTTGWGATLSGIATFPTGTPFGTVQPQAQSAVAGAAATLSVTATGTPAPAYQWRKGGVAITGATSASYGIASVTAADAGSYDVVLTNSVGTVTSAAAVLTVTGLGSDGYVFSSSGSEVILTGYTGPSGALTVPSTLVGLPVTAIGDNCFYGKGLTRVEIPASVKSIGIQAFLDNSALAEVVIPTGVTAISHYAFARCGLTSLSLPATVTSLGIGPFFGNPKLTWIEVDAVNPGYMSLTGVLFDKAQTTLIQFPGGLSGYYAVPGTVKTVQSYSFHGSASLTAVVIPEGVTAIGTNAFMGCTMLRTVSLPASLTGISSQPFAGCSSLVSIVVDPLNPAFSSVAGALYDKAQSRLIQVPAGLKGAFSIPSGVTTIASGAFRGASVTGILVPVGVTTIDHQAFIENGSLSRVVFLGDAPAVQSGIFPGGVSKVYYASGRNGWGATLSGVPTEAFSAPVILYPPQSRVISAGGVTAFSVAAASVPSASYQWRKGGVAIVGATHSALVLPSVRSVDAGNYDVVVTNSAGSTTSAAATLTVETGLLWGVGTGINGLYGASVGQAVPKPVARGRMIAAGGQHSLWVGADGLLYSTGDNLYGQLGDGGANHQSFPVRVQMSSSGAPNPSFLAISTRSNHGLLLQADGSLWAMGLNSSGQLGDGSTSNRYKPVQVAAGVSAISAGSSHSLFLRIDGTLWAMGLNSSGQLGDGSTTNRSSPVQVAAGVSAVSAGGNHSLFLKSDGTLWAMGNNGSGQLGDGTTTNRSAPVQVAIGVSAINSGSSHSLFLKSDGSLWAMGANGSGQLGNGSNVSQSAPVQVANGVTAISAGGSHSLFLKAGGEMWAVGFNRRGQLGDGTTINRNTPVKVATGVESIQGGGSHSLFVTADGTIWGMGWNAQGQLGDGSTGLDGKPVLVATEVVAAAVGNGHTLFQRGDSSLWGLGVNGSGQLGDPSLADRTVAAKIADAVSEFAVGYDHSLFLRADGALFGMGNNSSGQLGDGSNTNASEPKQIATGVTGVGAGYNHSLFIRADGSLWATGLNNFGQLGDGTNENRSSPVQVATGVRSVVGGGNFSLFVKHDGTLWAMGENSSGQLGDGSTINRSSPFQVASGVVAASAGWSHSLYLSEDGSVWTVGSGQTGQLGDGLNSRRSVPAKVFSGAAAIAAANVCSAFVDFSGAVWTAGWNYNGNLASGGNGGSSVPVRVQTGILSFFMHGTRTVFLQRSGLAPAPVFSAPLAGASVSAGQPVTLRANASGFGPLDYQWMKDGVAIEGLLARKPEFSIVSAQAPDAGAYSVRVRNSAGEAVSNVAPVAVSSTLAITGQPASQVVPPGANVSLCVTAVAVDPVSYQWRKNGVPIVGAINACLVFANFQAPDLGSYDVIVSSVAGSVTSVAAQLTLAGSTSIASISPSPLVAGGSLAVALSNPPASGTITARLGTTNLPAVISGVLIHDDFNRSGALTGSSPVYPGSGLSWRNFPPDVNDTLIRLDGSRVEFPAGASGSDDREPSLPLMLPPNSVTRISARLTVSGGVWSEASGFSGWLGLGLLNGSVTNPGIFSSSGPMVGLSGDGVAWSHASYTSSALDFRVHRPGMGAGNVTLSIEVDNRDPAAIKATFRANDIVLGSSTYGAAGFSSDRVILRSYLASGGTVDDFTVTSTAGLGVVAGIPPTITAGSQTLSLTLPGNVTLSAPVTVAGGTPVVTSPSTASTAVGVAFPYQITASNSPTSFAATGLPAGLSLNTTTGLISGTPTLSGVYNIVLTATNAAGTSAPMTLILTVGVEAGTPVITSASTASATVGAPFSYQITATNSPTSFAATALPPGLALNAATGVISGTATAAGTYAVTLSASNVAGSGGAATLSIIVGAVQLAPAITTQPQSQTVSASGGTVSFTVAVSGTPAPALQWYFNGASIAGATGTTLTLTNVQASAAGNYWVVATNGAGSVKSSLAAFSLTQPGNSATQALVGPGYTAGQSLTVTNTLNYTGTASALSWAVLLPPGWSFASAAGSLGDTGPSAGATDVLEWAWTSVPPSPVTFTYTLNIPAGTSGPQEIVALGGVRNGASLQFLAQPDPLPVPQVTTHSADTDRNFRIALLELTRVIELYNTRNGTTRTGCYAVATIATEDGFAPDAARASSATVTLTRYHSADSNRDGKLSLLELTRVIELYNYRSGTTRTGQYKVQAGTEDGFAPGPADPGSVATAGGWPAKLEVTALVERPADIAAGAFGAAFEMKQGRLAVWQARDMGRVFVYDLPESGSLNRRFTISAPDASFDNPSFGTKLAFSGADRLFISNPFTWISQPHDGRIYSYSMTGTTTAQLVYRQERNPHSAGYFGSELAIGGDILMAAQGTNPGSWQTRAGSFFYRVNSDLSLTFLGEELRSDFKAPYGGSVISGDYAAIVYADDTSGELRVTRILRQDGAPASVGQNVVIPLPVSAHGPARVQPVGGASYHRIAASGNMIAVAHSGNEALAADNEVRLYQITETLSGFSVQQVATISAPPNSSAVWARRLAFAWGHLLVSDPLAVVNGQTTRGLVHVYRVDTPAQPSLVTSISSSRPARGGAFGEFLSFDGPPNSPGRIAIGMRTQPDDLGADHEIEIFVPSRP